MGFMKDIINESGEGINCTATYIREKLICDYKLGIKSLDKDGKVDFDGIPLRTVSSYKKKMIEWGIV